MKEFENKELVRTYTKNGFTVKTYRPIMSKKERMIKDAQIKYDVINIIKELTVEKEQDNNIGSIQML